MQYGRATQECGTQMGISITWELWEMQIIGSHSRPKES